MATRRRSKTSGAGKQGEQEIKSILDSAFAFFELYDQFLFQCRALGRGHAEINALTSTQTCSFK
jgi:hypothetical protein